MGKHASEVCKAGHYSPVYPIWNVERAVGSKSREVVRRDRFGLAGPLEQEQLRKDGDGFQEDGEGP